MSPLSVRFTPDDLALFAGASWDRNPLHSSEGYARATQFGQPVVFGVLGGLSCLAAVPLAAGMTVGSVKMEFIGPLFVGIDYQLDVGAVGDSEIVVALSDGPRVLIRSTFKLVEGAQAFAPLEPAHAVLRPEAAQRSLADLPVGLQITGTYQPDAALYEALVARMNLDRLTVAPSRIATLLWASYVVGMELPGRQALFSEVTCEFTPEGEASSPIDFSATIRSASPRYGLVVAGFETTSAGRAHSRGEIRAFVRKERQPAAVASVSPGVDRDSLLGKTALVIGGSRGLGAAIATTLAMRGATVYASYQRCAAEMERICAVAASASGVIHPLQGDGSDPEWCGRAVNQIRAAEGRLDILICNAAPAVLPMPFSAFSIDRLNRYVAASFALVSNPVAASLDALSQTQGWAVAVSSAFANFDSPQFARARASYPHYVAAKSAIEGLFHSLAANNAGVGFVLARPPRLDGELPVPFGEGTALAPVLVADRLISLLVSTERPDRKVLTIEDFR